jgi:natural resistance-associated macrophage protein
MFAIIVATAQTLHAHGKTSIQSAAQAAQALTPFAGHFASALFALGFIGSGLLAIPVLAGAGSVGMAGLLGKQWGFERSIRKAPVFYGLVALGTVGGTGLSLLHVNPIKLLTDPNRPGESEPEFPHPQAGCADQCLSHRMTELADPGVHAAIDVVALDRSARMRVRSAPPSPGCALSAVHLPGW